MNNSPFMVTVRDGALLGLSGRSDAMGILAVWSVRGRDLVPHLTEQTTEVRGFQILVEAFRLWESYEPDHTRHAGRLDDFFLLIEQAFARTVGWRDKDWSLPGALRVKARSSEAPRISLQDPDWHLLGGQKANGLWGLYRGASYRAGLLTKNMTRLTEVTKKQTESCSLIDPAAHFRLFSLVERAMDGCTVALPTDGTDNLVVSLYNTFWNLPLAEHLHAKLIANQEPTIHLAKLLLNVRELDHRAFLTAAAEQLHDHQAIIHDVIRCEDLLAVAETVFLWLCSSKGRTVDAVAEDLPLDMQKLAKARVAFGNSGIYLGPTAVSRYNLVRDWIDTSNHSALLRSVLKIHRQVCDERKRAPWVEENDQGILSSYVDVVRPDESNLLVGKAWRNDYYLEPLRRIARQISEVHS